MTQDDTELLRSYKEAMRQNRGVAISHVVHQLRERPHSPVQSPRNHRSKSPTPSHGDSTSSLKEGGSHHHRHHLLNSPLIPGEYVKKVVGNLGLSHHRHETRSEHDGSHHTPVKVEVHGSPHNHSLIPGEYVKKVVGNLGLSHKEHSTKPKLCHDAFQDSFEKRHHLDAGAFQNRNNLLHKTDSVAAIHPASIKAPKDHREYELTGSEELDDIERMTKGMERRCFKKSMQRAEESVERIEEEQPEAMPGKPRLESQFFSGNHLICDFGR
mmetsp:Transcript_27865/g.64563  ORF Transcript_27865/g.64563 Transcript_27865/m.64563 type:complete len:269 (-) Transcript_27865:275-1081(-)